MNLFTNLRTDFTYKLIIKIIYSKLNLICSTNKKDEADSHLDFV